MVGRSAILFPLALLALLAALTLWIDRLVQPPEPKPDGSSRHDPDYKLTNFSTSKTDKDGNPRYMLAAVEMAHYPDDDSTHLTRPRFTQYSATKPFTQIQGQRGMVTSDGDNVHFMDNVRVVRGATKQKGELTVLTDYLHIIPDQELVVTDRPVLIRQAPRTVIHATGMEYNKKLGTLKLFKRVKVHYERPQGKLRPLSAPKKAAVTKKKVSGSKAPVKATKQVKTGNTKTRVRRQYDKLATQP
jgi:lipopolysaccharide export system protein LptC